MSKNIPKTVEGLNNSSYFYYRQKLLKMIYSIFKIENTPEEWDIPYFKETLFTSGVVVVTDTPVGIIPLQCGYSGLNVFNHPTDFIVNNPVLGSFRGKIDDDGVMVYISLMDRGYQSVNQLVERYATLLAEIDASLQTTLINSRVAHVFYANSTAQVKTMQKMYDEISSGKPAVFIRKTGLDDDMTHAIFNNVKSSFIGIELLDTKRTILNEFLTEIGVNNANTDKKERLLTDEVNANNSEMKSNISEWFTNLKECISKVNAKYGLNITVDYDYDVIQKETNNELQSY